jgi:KaiC/GvpD/RAD55 family RecA-like ATPase
VVFVEGLGHAGYETAPETAAAAAAPAEVSEDRIKTYVKGLDEKLGGGIPRAYIVLICGTAGSMKSSFAFNILYHNALQEDRRGWYITIEQERGNLLEHMASLGMAVEEGTELSKKLTVVDFGTLRSEVGDENLPMVLKTGRREVAPTDLLQAQVSWPAALSEQLGRWKEANEFDILVIDSLDALYALIPMTNPRTILFHFFQELRKLNVTTFLVAEMSRDTSKYGTHGVEEFLSDGIIHLDLIREGWSVKRFLGIVKMRKTRHDMNYYPLLIEKGFEIVTR